MQNTGFIDLLEAYGADMRGINDRFMGDVALYEQCFAEFMKEPNLVLLEEAVKAQNYAEAFEAAHALKGISGNLGLTPYYEAVCALVESLRAKDYAPIEAEYQSVAAAFARLRTLSAGEGAPDAIQETPTIETPTIETPTIETPTIETPLKTPVSAAQPAAAPSPKEKKIKPSLLGSKLFVPTVAVGLMIVIIFITLVFNNFIENYQSNSDIESASHLVEINQQIKLYIEEAINND